MNLSNFHQLFSTLIVSDSPQKKEGFFIAALGNPKPSNDASLPRDFVLKIPKSLEHLEVVDLAERFDRHWDRIEGGRLNELLFREVEDIFPSNYSMIIERQDLHYRYVR